MARAQDLRSAAARYAAEAKAVSAKDVREGLRTIAEAFEALATQDEQSYAGDKPKKAGRRAKAPDSSARSQAVAGQVRRRMS